MKESAGMSQSRVAAAAPKNTGFVQGALARHQTCKEPLRSSVSLISQTVGNGTGKKQGIPSLEEAMCTGLCLVLCLGIAPFKT